MLVPIMIIYLQQRDYKHAQLNIETWIMKTFFNVLFLFEVL